MKSTGRTRYSSPRKPRGVPADPRQEHFEALKEAYPGRKLLIVSNTSGATSFDKDRQQADAVEKATGVHVLSHGEKKPGCGAEVMEYFKSHPETRVTSPAHVAIVGDRLTTDIMMANMMGSWGFWVKDGVVPLSQKSVVGDASCDVDEMGTDGCSFRGWRGGLLRSCWRGTTSPASRVAPEAAGGFGLPVLLRHQCTAQP